MKKKIIIQGAGKGTRTFKISTDSIFDYVAYFDRNLKILPEDEGRLDGIPLHNDPSLISKMQYDYIFMRAQGVTLIQREYHNLYGIPYEKMIPIKHIGGKSKFDQIASLANEIAFHGIPGSVAELGVNYGDTAFWINVFFNDRTFYLFDTFTGFDGRDVDFEKEKGTMRPEEVHYFDLGRSPEGVMGKLLFKDQAVIKQGYFPDSLDGLEDTFSFVHIDCDLQKPIQAGLEYFYPRLSKGGAICVHDFRSLRYPGARIAVREFCAKHNIIYTPIFEYGGVVIRKPF